MTMLTKLPSITERPHDMLTEADPPTFQIAWELAHLCELYHIRQPRRVLEIGVFYGGTLAKWLQLTAPGATVVGIDLPAYNAPNPERWHQWAADAGQRLVVFQGNSMGHAARELAQHYAPYDWLHIDGDHSYEAVRSDWDAYAPMVAPGGVIVLHDINERDGYGVSRLWREIQSQGYVTQEINAQARGLCGIGVVHV